MRPPLITVSYSPLLENDAKPAVNFVLRLIDPPLAVILMPVLSKLVPKPASSLMFMPLASKLVACSIVVTSPSRSMPLIVSPTSLPFSTKDLAVIAPPSITVWSPSAPTVILLSATTVSPTVMPALLIIVPPALMVLVLISPSVTTVLPIVIPSLSNLAMPSIVVTPSPLGTLPSTGSR